MAKLEIRYHAVDKKYGWGWYDLFVNGERLDNISGAELKEDLSSIGIQEDRVRVEFSIENKYVKNDNKI